MFTPSDVNGPPTSICGGESVADSPPAMETRVNFELLPVQYRYMPDATSPADQASPLAITPTDPPPSATFNNLLDPSRCIVVQYALVSSTASSDGASCFV